MAILRPSVRDLAVGRSGPFQDAAVRKGMGTYLHASGPAVRLSLFIPQSEYRTFRLHYGYPWDEEGYLRQPTAVSSLPEGRMKDTNWTAYEIKDRDIYSIISIVHFDFLAMNPQRLVEQMQFKLDVSSEAYLESGG